MSSNGPKSEQELEEHLMNQGNFANKRQVLETVGSWIAITLGLIALFFYFTSKETRYLIFGPSNLLAVAFLSLFILLMLFVINFAVGANAGFTTAALIFVPEVLEVEKNERLRMWDLRLGMLGPFIITVISFLLYFTVSYFQN